MRDRADNFVVICSIENFDPMGIHTGDSVTVAPAQTLTDREYQVMRNAARQIIREVGVETGGSNIQFAVDPKTGRMVVIEMNPRVSRSSALASKATGFPIAKIAALLAIGYRLDEIKNDITRVTPASFEPVLDYVVVKIPRWAFEKFRDAEPGPGHADEVGGRGHGHRPHLQGGAAEGAARPGDRRQRLQPLRPRRRAHQGEAAHPGPRPHLLREARARPGLAARGDQPHDRDRPLVPRPDPADRGPGEDDRGRADCSRRRVAARGQALWASPTPASRSSSARARARRTCARGAWPRGSCPSTSASTPAPRSSSRTRRTCTRPTRRSARPSPATRKKVMILGSGPNRIGQGIEFDYCCCHASFAFHEEGYETIMVNCNPETVSTDYDTSDRLYFEPLTFEDVMNIVELEKPEGVVIQFGGQTPLKLALPLHRAGVKILGTSPDAIDLAEDRKRFSALLRELDIPQPESGTATSLEEAKVVAAAHRLPGAGPALVRPGRPRHGHRLRRGAARGLRARGGAGLARAPDPGRPLPGGRLRGGRGRGGRRRARGDRRHPAAHRGGGHPQRRLGHGAAHLQDHGRRTWRRSATTRGGSAWPWTCGA